MSPVVGVNMTLQSQIAATTAAATTNCAGDDDDVSSSPSNIMDSKEEWPALGSPIVKTSFTATGAVAATAAAAAPAASAINMSTESDWEMLSPHNHTDGGGGEGVASTKTTLIVGPPVSRTRRSQTIGTEHEAFAGGGKSSSNNNNNNNRNLIKSRPVLKHCHSSPDLRHSLYELESIDSMDGSSGESSSDSSGGDGGDFGSALMINSTDGTANRGDMSLQLDDNDDEEASSSVVLVSGPPSVVTAATSSSVWSMATPATSKLSFRDAVGTQPPPQHRHGHRPHHHDHRRRQNKLKKSKIVVVAPSAAAMRRCSKSTGDLKSLGLILEQQEADEEEHQRMRYRGAGRHRFPQHFYPKSLDEDHTYGDGDGHVGGFTNNDVLGETDAQEFYNRKEHGKLGRENGLKSRPDESKRLDIILAKKDLQREQQQQKQKGQKAAKPTGSSQSSSSSGNKKKSGGSGSKGRTRW
jgi:hypothetical protein